MAQKIIGILLLALLPIGCAYIGARGELNRLIDKHRVMYKKDAWRLKGPYKFKRILSPTEIEFIYEVDDDGLPKTTRLKLRGCISTGHPEYDFECISSLYRYNIAVYLYKDCTIIKEDGAIISVPYAPAHRYATGMDKFGNFKYDVVTYVSQPIWYISKGWLLVDHSDTDYPLYEAYKRAEELAKKLKRGYWGLPQNKPSLK